MTPPRQTPPPVAPPTTAAAEPLRDLACVGCGYNLRGLPRDGRCPECGTPVGQTIDAVYYYDGGAAADPRWLRTIAWAALPLAAAKVLWVVAAWVRFDRSMIPQWMGIVPAFTGPKLWQAAAMGTGLGPAAVATTYALVVVLIATRRARPATG